MLISGGLDHDLLVWPFISNTPIGTLKGSPCATLQIEAGPSPTQVLTLGADSVVRLWDVRKMRLVQVINPTYGVGASEKNSDISVIGWTNGEGSNSQRPISAICFDESDRALVTGYQHLAKWRSGIVGSCGNPGEEREGMTWREAGAATTLVAYSPDFDVAVSAHQGSLLSVWRVATGELSARMREAHGTSEISSLAIIPLEPRVLSGAHDGVIKLWNFTTGQCLKQFIAQAHSAMAEVTDLVLLQLKSSRHVFSVGWSLSLIHI